jgi:hypothetical protein
VCFTYALLTDLRVMRYDAQGQRTRGKMASVSVAVTQDELWRLLWNDLVAYLKEKSHGDAVIAELEQLCVARTKQESVKVRSLP